MFWKWNCRWDVDINTDCCSEAIKIIFSTMHSTICEIGEKSVKRQGCNVKDKVIKIVRCFLISSAYIFLLIKIVRYFLLSLYFPISKVFIAKSDILFLLFSHLLVQIAEIKKRKIKTRLCFKIRVT